LNHFGAQTTVVIVNFTVLRESIYIIYRSV